MQTTQHAFQARDLVGGHVVLDLVNTVTARNALPIDWLDGYPRALEWARVSGVVDDGIILELERLSSADPAEADRAMVRLRDLRESLLEAFTAEIQQRDPPQRALGRLERAWKDAVAVSQLRSDGNRVIPVLSVARSGLDYIRHDLVLRALDLLASAPLDRTRICPGDRCGWLFVDRSRGGQRRWCDMATCGNASKSRRHYERQRDRATRHAAS
jgi:predicted RNA-binding Zn ribbon-like protein